MTDNRTTEVGRHSKRVRNFKCDVCNESFHIKRYNASWVRFMPPNFCPMCGTKVIKED